MIRCNILCGIILVLMVINGCDGKPTFPVQMKTDAFIQEKSVESMDVEHEAKTQEEFIYVDPIDGKVGITLKRSAFRNGSIEHDNQIEYVDQNLTELKFFKSSIIEVKGLWQLKLLDTLIFDKCSVLRDFSFLREAPQLKRLFIENSTELGTNWSFIEDLPDLEVLYIGSHRNPKIMIDLKNN